MTSQTLNPFDRKLADHGLALRREDLRTLQLNVGRQCNQACRHCHVDAAPWRTEMIDEATARRIGHWIRAHRPAVVDITGGAPEISAHFRYFVTTSREAGAHVIDRNNLTILEEPGYENLADFLAAQQVEIVASLPCYSAANVNKQRGQGVFDKSIRALRKLNDLGYGLQPDLPLNLVYNPVGARLPGPQEALEADYKEALREHFGITFNRLFTITNQPIARFAEDLRRQGQWDAYLELLANSFNPATVDGLMCRSTLSVGYDGSLYDCDFNQMLELSLPANRRTRSGQANGRSPRRYLWDIRPEDLKAAPIRTGMHCLACTAGAGSSCTGALRE